MPKSRITYFQLSSAIFIFLYQLWRISLVGVLQFYFLTNYTWFINGFYFTFAVLHSYGYEYPRVLHALFSMSQTLSFNITLLFWILLSNVFQTEADLATKIDWVISHTFSLILPLLDVWFGNQSLAWKDAVYPITFYSLYNIFIFCCRIFFKLPYPYPFLEVIDDPATGLINPVFAISMYVVFCIILLLMTGLAKAFIYLRNRMRPSVGSPVQSLLPQTNEP